MNKKILFLIFAVSSLISSAKTYKLDGMIGGKYPIVIELEEFDGLYFGRYAYKSTLEKNGNLDCSWLNINPNYENPASVWDVRDCKFEAVETWFKVQFDGGKRLTARMRNTKDKVYDVVATVTASTIDSPSTVAHFKQHIGDYASEFYMFRDPSFENRFESMMGENNFAYLTQIYQVETPVEYTKGMYWASAFVAHQCCDPAVLWAYDSYNDAFYVWIRKDDRDYWWSETGSIPYNFRELVSAKF